MNKTLAQINNPVLKGLLRGEQNTGGTAIGSLISALVGAFLIFAFVTALFFLIIGGYEWITSGGDKAKLQSARDRITNAIMGLIIIAATWALMSLVGSFLGIEFPNMVIPTVGS